MSNKKTEMIESYIKAGISPVLLEEFPQNIFNNAVILDSDCPDSLLNGHYEGTEFVGPKWYDELVEKSKNANYSLLLIPDLNKIEPEEQIKFLELFKYKKISTFELPKNSVIIATCSDLKENPVLEEIYALTAHI